MTGIEVPYLDGLNNQKREYWFNRIAEYLPDLAAAAAYEDLELLFYRLINEGLISDLQQGAPGNIASVSITALPPDSSPTATISGPSNNRSIAFGIPSGVGPKGDKGDKGDPGADSTVPGPAGTAATISSATATTLAAGSSATVSLGGTSTNRTFTFGIPRGADGTNGTSATISSATANTLAAGASATVTLGGTSTNRTFTFGIPRGDKGEKGDAVPNVYVEGVPLYNFGHSYTMYPYPYSTKLTGEYYLKVARRLKLGDVYPLGRSATIAIDNFGRLLSSKYDGGKAYWTPGSKGIVLIQNTMNELGSSSAADATFRNMWKMGIMGEIALASSAQTKDFTQASLSSGTWQKHNNAEAKKGMNGVTYFSSTASAYVEWTFSGTEVFFVAPISKTAYAVGAWNVTVDGTTKISSTNTTGMKMDYTDAVTGVNENYTPGIWRITGLSNTSHTLRFNRESGNAFVNGIIIPAPNPPLIIIGKEPTRGGSAAAIYTANIGWYNSEIDNFVASFSNVYSVDLAVGWDNNTMVGSLDTGSNFHPNDIGHSLIADHFTRRINELVTTWTDGVVIL